MTVLDESEAKLGKHGTMIQNRSNHDRRAVIKGRTYQWWREREIIVLNQRSPMYVHDARSIHRRTAFHWVLSLSAKMSAESIDRITESSLPRIIPHPDTMTILRTASASNPFSISE